MRPLALVAALAAMAASAPGQLERWLVNARERTHAGMAALEEGEAAAAAERMAAAARLAPAEPLARFNHGTARLAAGESAAAAQELERAVELAGGELAARALYNLGNAHATAGGWDAAIEAYKESLRRDPEQADTKVNLELALRRKAEQEERERKDEPQEERRQQEQQEQRQEAPGTGGEEQDAPPPEPRPAEPQGGAAGSRSALPNFQEQPDMTAEQAAAILEAVENMEREQRREAAAQRSRELPANEKDW